MAKNIRASSDVPFRTLFDKAIAQLSDEDVDEIKAAVHRWLDRHPEWISANLDTIINVVVCKEIHDARNRKSDKDISDANYGVSKQKVTREDANFVSQNVKF